MRPRTQIALLALAFAVGLSGCGEKAEKGPAERAASSEAGPGAGRPGLEKIASFEEPVHLAEPPGGDGTLLVVERGGTVRALDSDGRVASRPFLDVSPDVLTEGEAGLFSLAFDPAFARSGRFYIAFAAREGRLVVEGYRADPKTLRVDPRSRREVLSIPHPELVHWGGLLAFGPDGGLYLGTGDGGPPYPIPSTSQDSQSMLGKLLRVDPDRGTAEVAALGLRNPWRYSFDHRTGDLWIGDVGDFTQEEVDFLPAGRVRQGVNFGWPDLEGTAQTTSDVSAPDPEGPLFTYARTGHEDDPVCAITGGYVVRDPELARLEGSYLYADFCEGEILSLERRAKGAPRSKPTGLEVPRLVSFAEDASAHLYASPSRVLFTASPPADGV